MIKFSRVGARSGLESAICERKSRHCSSFSNIMTIEEYHQEECYISNEDIYIFMNVKAINILYQGSHFHETSFVVVCLVYPLVHR